MKLYLILSHQRNLSIYSENKRCISYRIFEYVTLTGSRSYDREKRFYKESLQRSNTRPKWTYFTKLSKKKTVSTSNYLDDDIQRRVYQQSTLKEQCDQEYESFLTKMQKSPRRNILHLVIVMTVLFLYHGFHRSRASNSNGRRRRNM